MPESNFTLRVDDDLKEAFTVAARQHDRTGAQLLRDFMRDYVQKARETDAYEAWFRDRVEAGRADVRARRVSSNEDVEARFAARRAAAAEAARNKR